MDVGQIDLGAAGTTLESRFVELDAPVLMTGIQALVRVLLEQARLDRAAGLNTARLVSGYRGSPLGGLDQELWRRAKLLTAHDVRFQPGLNEDLAATMLWGAQQIDAFPGKKYDGVTGLWYGKGPGVDRSGDALRCANMLGTNVHGGVLAVSGDDHGAHSSTYPHQTEHVFEGAMIPVLAPADARDILDLGLAGIALSRFSGLWCALKTTAEIAEQAASVIVPSERHFALPDLPPIAHPRGFDPSLRFPRDRAELERRVMEDRIPAALAFARANGLDRLVRGTDAAEIGIVTVGKAHTDTLHALDMLGLRTAPHIAVYKVAMTWPLETEGLARFARGKRALLVVEEKRSFVEAQIRAALYNMPADARPTVAGKADIAGRPLLPAVMELSPELVADSLTRVLADCGHPVAAARRNVAPVTERPAGLLARTPAFCAGCPHSTSTKLPDGSFAMAGIGCHFMALDTSDQTRTFTHMGGEGVTWVGLAPFTDTPHMFVNMGDGTFQHSGLLAIRQAVAAGTRMTYKVLFNDAVAMTGGQPAEGGPTVGAIAAQIAAEGVARLAIVADDVARLPPASALPPGTTLHGRDDLDAVQRDMRERDGVSVIIYDQVCATEKRRRRKRGGMAQPTTSVIINEAVCENCGDCSTQSGCIAIEPVETELGRKRRINPTSCNVDLSCLKGFCPSFVTVDGPPRAPGADPQWAAREAELTASLRTPALPATDLPWRGLFAGIGGGGIVTAGAIVAMAAQLDGLHVSTLDFTGLAQKNGAVVSHVQMVARAEADRLDVVRIPLASADLMVAADLAVSAGPGVLERCAPGAAVIGNLDLAATADFRADARLKIDAGLHRRAIERGTDPARSVYLHAVTMAERLFGNAQAMNTMLLGLAWQRGLVPVSHAALDRAIELNGAAVAVNRRAFAWGRILADRPELAAEILHGSTEHRPPMDLDALIAHRADALTRYQGERLARRYRARVAEASAREAAVFGTPGPLARAAAEGWFRVLAYKDEYEVARLHAETDYSAHARPVFHMAPPLLSRVDARTGRRRKIAVSGRVALPLFRVLRLGRVLRGTPLDPFGWQADRRMERQMIRDYRDDMRAALAALSPATLDTAVALAEGPDRVRGYGPVKMENWRREQTRRAELLSALRAPAERPALAVAAE
jgi:indolepyruvate ferredoxin oxidoreductase